MGITVGVIYHNQNKSYAWYNKFEYVPFCNHLVVKCQKLRKLHKMFSF